MSILSFPSAVRARPAHAGVLRVVGGLFGQAVRGWRAYKAIRAMSGLSEDQLHDIGVARSEIDHVTRYGRAPRR